MVQHIERIGEALIWVPVGVLSLTALGLLWALPAALICRLVAHFKGLNDGSFGGAGARYSVLLVLPWIYFLGNLIYGRSAFPATAVVLVYLALYCIWLSFMGLILVALAVYVTDIVAGNWNSLGVTLFSIIVLAVILLICAYTWITSLKNLWRSNTALNKAVKNQPRPFIPEFYLEAFGWLIAWSFVTVVAVGLTGLLGFVGT